MKFDVQRIITRDTASGMHHIRFVIGGKTYTSEADTLDDRAAYTVVPDLPEDIECARWCRVCFPDLHDPRPANAEET